MFPNFVCCFASPARQRVFRAGNIRVKVESPRECFLVGKIPHNPVSRSRAGIFRREDFYTSSNQNRSAAADGEATRRGSSPPQKLSSTTTTAFQSEPIQVEEQSSFTLVDFEPDRKSVVVSV
ncbi:hypothetical protein EVAR_48743_1 [Eumeta japonica]|uniref:Uncharacterized protein n=1 Tax=Eumeta variegata TaxID=151549 RepID=A0A4C1YIF8_EUMVA|nr:hypothetical protein EVAR_48743_1 [Eumeta japonica]